VNYKEGGGQFFFSRFARELIPCSSTLKMMAPPLNAGAYAISPDPVSNAILLELGLEEKEWGRDRGGCSLK